MIEVKNVVKSFDGFRALDGLTMTVYENTAVKRRMAVIGDDWYYFPQSGIREMAKFYAGLYPAFSWERYQKLKEVFPLDEKLMLRRMSKGMQKQAAFWLTVCCMPEYLILDEPVTGLDPAAAQELYRTLDYLNKKEGIAIVTVTHDIRSALRYATHILHAGHGTYFFGTAAEYLASPWGKRFGGDGV